MNDSLIFKQAAIDVADAVCSVTEDENVAKVWDRLKDLSSTQPETCAYWDRESNFCALHRPSTQPKRGKWIKMSNADGDYYVCDQCGEELPRYTTESPTWDNPYPPKYSIDKTNFCPNCGADMRGES